MASSRPSRTHYAPLPASEDALDRLEQGPHRTSSRRLRRKTKSPLAFELDTLFRRWTATINQRMQLKRSRRKRAKSDLVDQRDRSKPVEILASVFEPVTDSFYEGLSADDSKGRTVVTLDHESPMTRAQFDELVDAVEEAIDAGVHPRLNSKGSSGSYFARNKVGQTVGIFKPKDEEPYGRLNPKFTKYVHRVFLSRIIPFGRACLIPNLSYLSESAASLLDRRLETYIVPRTEVVSLASPAFYYDWIDRERAGRKGKLRDKDGSFQVFLKGFTDASVFLRDHPIPGRPLSQTLDTSPHRKGHANLFGPLKCMCGRADAEEDDFDNEGEIDEEDDTFRWTEEMINSFREELEKLVILDYLIRNTDRGLDNFMVKACTCTTRSGSPTPLLRTEAPGPQPPMSETGNKTTWKGMNAAFAPSEPHVHLAAIDNSLAFPHAHPTGWRTFSYGWLHLPLSLIGHPFSVNAQKHFLPKLTSTAWWAETTLQLRTLFAQDPDFKERMFYKQMAVMKGQACNIVQALLENEGPVELCRRPKRLVWDDFIEVADDEITEALISGAMTPADQRAPAPEVKPVPARSRDDPSVASRDAMLFAPASAPAPPMSYSTHSPPIRVSQKPSTSPFARRPSHNKSLSVSSILSASEAPKSSPGLSLSTPAFSSELSDSRQSEFEFATSDGQTRLSESVTGIDMVRHMDWVEFGEGRGEVTREERRRQRYSDDLKAQERLAVATGLSKKQALSVSQSRADQESADARESADEGDDESDDHVGDLSWGVVSESDARRSPNIHGMFSDSDDVTASTRPVTRHRSGSLTHLPSTVSREDSFSQEDAIDRRRSEDASRRRQRPALSSRGARSRYSVDAQTRLDGLDELDEDSSTRNVPQRVVVVERLETLKDEPKPNFFQWLCGEVEQA
ncbi:Phosphatidylinositol 4-kinase LSB6 [Microbotryomycetes sp. JL201]|nr:Phosphatidylinositol 4-kinase LSB6 [Microbotryomycetes sp. JL201]